MRFVLVVCAAAAAFGQSDRTIQLTQNQTRQELEQMAAVLRAIADLPQVSIDDTKRTVTAAGAASQIAMAEWLARQLDLPANGQLSGVQEYRPPNRSDDAVRVFHVPHAPTPLELQEIATVIRSVADVRRLYIYIPLSAVAARGTDQQMSLAAWLTERLGQPPAAATPTPHVYRLPGDEIIRVFELAYPQTPQQLQEIATLIRSIGDIPRLFVYQGRRMVTVRATREQVELAAWLVSELDRPLDGIAAMQDVAAKHEHWLSSSPDNLVRIFYLPGFQTAEKLQQAAVQVRTTTGIRRLFTYNALRALAARGTVGQLATAERLIEEMKAR